VPTAEITDLVLVYCHFPVHKRTSAAILRSTGITVNVPPAK
jgi:hypothetical protein